MFSENFWGEKINGFDVLCQNLKHSLTSVKDLETFLRECVNCEDTYGKVLNKLVSQTNKFSTNGTFNPIWSLIKELNEKYASAHVQQVQHLQELIKEIQRYNDELSKKIKKIRENETQTQNVVQSFQEITQTLNKTKDQYHNLCIEFEKQKRQLDPQQLIQYQQLSQQISSSSLFNGVMGGSNATGGASSVAVTGPIAASKNTDNSANAFLNAPFNITAPTSNQSASDRLTSLATSITANKATQVQKLEKKCKLALEDYKACIEKYNTIRLDFERKLADSCNHFQSAEETHLKQMRAFIETYSKLMHNLNTNKQLMYNEFSLRFSEQFTVDYLIHLFIENKRTGIERPDVAQFIEHSTQINSPTPTLNENDFNLVLNGHGQVLTGDLLDGRGAADITSLATSISANNISLANLNATASVVNGINNRGTPVFFTGSNYTQLTNATSVTTLNSTVNVPSSASPNSLQQSIISANEGQVNGVNNTSTTSKKSDTNKGLNIFNVDFLGRNKNKEKKNKAANESITSKSKFSRSKKSSKQTPPTTTSASLNTAPVITTTSSVPTMPTNGNNESLFGPVLANNGLSKDSISINSEDSTGDRMNVTINNMSLSNTNANHNLSINLNSITNTSQNKTPPIVVSKNVEQPSGSITARSISSITGSLSLDPLDHLKLNSNGSDQDSELNSLRPDSSIDLRRKAINQNAKDNEDMNNLYGSSSTSDSDDSDSENGSLGGQVKVMLKIKPKSELADENQQQQNNTGVLREIGKTLQLKHTVRQCQQVKKRSYYYNYGTANPEQASSGWTTTANINEHNTMTRSVSVNSVLNPPLTSTTTSTTMTTSTSGTPGALEQPSANLLDLTFSTTSITPTTTRPASVGATSNPASATNGLHTSMSLSKVGENTTSHLYNIDEDKEVESSFQYNHNKKTSTQMSQSMNTDRFTPACFPGRTTPDFRHTTSLFEQQGTRASIISPLTVNGSDIIPIAIAFNETIHAYFRMDDPSRFKVKCFGCMKVSFPFAILKLLAIELPVLEFRLNNLQIANQDLKVNNQLLTLGAPSQQSSFEMFANSSIGSNTSMNASANSLDFKFIMANLTSELKQQHQQNKLAAFFNFELLKYEFKYTNTPLTLEAKWSSNPSENTVELNMNYLFNFRKHLSQVNFMLVLPVSNQYKVQLVSSEPKVLVQEADSKLQVLWQLATVNKSGNITAKFSVQHKSPLEQNQPSINLEQFYQPVYAKFHVDNETLSQVKFDILSPNYKLSLLKEKIESGKYFCNYDQQQQQSQQAPQLQAKIPGNDLNTEANKSASEQKESLSTPNGPSNTSEPNTSIESNQSQKNPRFAGTMSHQIGSTVDVLLNY